MDVKLKISTSTLPMKSGGLDSSRCIGFGLYSGYEAINISGRPDRYLYGVYVLVVTNDRSWSIAATQTPGATDCAYCG